MLLVHDTSINTKTSINKMWASHQSNRIKSWTSNGTLWRRWLCFFFLTLVFQSLQLDGQMFWCKDETRRQNIRQKAKQTNTRRKLESNGGTIVMDGQGQRGPGDREETEYKHTQGQGEIRGLQVGHTRKQETQEDRKWLSWKWDVRNRTKQKSTSLACDTRAPHGDGDQEGGQGSGP